METARTPLLIPSCGVVAGIAVGLANGPPPLLALGVFAVLAIGLSRTNPGTAALVLFATALGFVRGEAAERAWLGRTEAEGTLRVAGRIVGDTDRARDGSSRFVVDDGRVAYLVHVPATSGIGRATLRSLLPGDRVVAWVQAPPVEPTRGPPRGADRRAFLKSGGLLRVEARGPPDPRRALVRLRRAGLARLDAIYAMHPESRAALGAMLFGRRGEDPELAETLRRAGVGHLLAISGLHVGWIAIVLLTILRRGPWPAWVRVGALAVSMLALVGLVGAAPAVRRAAAWLVVVQLAVAIGRRGVALNTLAWMAAALAVLDPWIVRAPAFAFTFLATGSIVGFAPGLACRMPGPGGPRLAVAVGIVTHVATAPLAAHWFHRVAPVSVLANLAAVPAAMVALAAGAASLAGIPGMREVATFAVDGLVLVARVAGTLPYAAIEVGRPPAGLLAAAAAIFLFVPRARASTALLLAAVVHLGPPPPAERAAPTLRVLDVGQGLSVSIDDGRGRRVLVDAPGAVGPQGGGPGATGRVVLPALRARGARWLSVLAASHADADHAGGLVLLIDRMRVDALWLPPGWHRSSVLREAAAGQRRRGGAVRMLRDGDDAGVGGLRFRARHAGPADADDNEGSLVLRLVEPEPGAMLPGDVGIVTERSLLAASPPPPVGLLVAGHHGSRHSTGAEWLRLLRPGVVVVSCGRRNRFGHPHAEFLERVHSAGATIVRTDRDGTLTFSPRCGSGREVEGEGDQRQREHRDGDPRESSSPFCEWRRLVQERWVPIPQP